MGLVFAWEKYFLFFIFFINCFPYLKHPQNLHPALISVLLLVSAVLSSLGEPGEGHVEDLEQDDGGDGGALVHGGVDVPQGSGHVQAVVPTSYADFPSELKRRKVARNFLHRRSSSIHEMVTRLTE